MTSRRVLLAATIVLLAACSSPPKVVEVPVRALPPAQLLEPCPAAARELLTNADLAGYVLDLQHALALCNNDKAVLRDWAKE